MSVTLKKLQDKFYQIKESVDKKTKNVRIEKSKIESELRPHQIKLNSIANELKTNQGNQQLLSQSLGNSSDMFN